jgi:oligo-1,6-glucosidase
VDRKHAAKLLAMWLFTLRGTIIMFQGQELAMTNPEEFSQTAIRDIETRIYWNAAHAVTPASGGGTQHLEIVKKAIIAKTRDASRVPIPVGTLNSADMATANRGFIVVEQRH